MNFTNGQIHELALAMQDWDAAKQKDKKIDSITDERILRISSKVKFAIIKNWKILSSVSDTIDEVLNEKFRELGGKIHPNGTGSWGDPTAGEKLLIKHKKDKSKLIDELEKIQTDTRDKQDQYDKYKKSLLAEIVSETKDGELVPQDFTGILSIKPTEDDIELLPPSVVEWYLANDLLDEPSWSDEEKPKDDK